MFCEKCGVELPQNAVFCSNCGSNIAYQAEENINDNEIQLIVKPTFKFEYMILPWFLIYMSIIITISLLIALMSISTAFLVFFISFFILLICVMLDTIITRKQYNNLTYNFYKTKVIYKDNFINLAEKEVKYKYIREIVMQQSFIQREINIGNIILYTNAEIEYNNGIYINNVENVEEIYKTIKNIVNI